MATATVPIRLSRYWPHPPSIKQAAFLSLPQEEALYGGAAGGGKSDALLMAALQYVDVPGYAALILRRTFKMLEQPDALILRSLEWLGPTDAEWNAAAHRWTFPTGATLQFGYLEHERHLDNYQGAAYHFIGWDELTQFPERYYSYVSFSRRRRRKDMDVPLRIRSASNPGNVGHDWVKQRFITEGRQNGRVFIPAFVHDNPGLDVEAYIASLQHLDHLTRQQLLDGNWDAVPPGDLFRAEWFERVEHVQDAADCKWVRFWDLAATEPSETNTDPDYTVGLKLARHPNGTCYVADVVRVRQSPGQVKQTIRKIADSDGQHCHVHIEQEPGSSGKTVVDDYVRSLGNRTVKGYRSTGKKWDRATVVSSKAEHGLVKLVRGAWNTAFLQECVGFKQDDTHAHDDQVDALSGAYQAHATKGEATSTPIPGRQIKPPLVKRGDLTLKGDRYVDK